MAVDTDPLPEIAAEAPPAPLPPPRPADLDPQPADPSQGTNQAEQVGGKQYLRELRLVVGNDSGNALDLSNLRVRFEVHTNDSGSAPANASIRIYNLAKATAKKLVKGQKTEFTAVQLDAGYRGDIGKLFDGEIIQIRSGRENPVDTYVHIVATHSGKAHNFGVVNKTLASGHTFKDWVQTSFEAMQKHNPALQLGFVADLGQVKMPRARTLFGMARDLMLDVGRATNTTWFIHENKLNVIKNGEPLPGSAFVINSSTGMVGLPVQTMEGIEVRTLLNRRIGPGTRLKIDEGSIQRAQMSPQTLVGERDQGLLPAINEADGEYKAVVIDHYGDTRGNDWYSEIIAISTGEGVIPPALTARGVTIPK